MKLLDTCFVIHLQREWGRGETGPAGRFLEAHAAEEFCIPVVTVLEFLEGYRQAREGESLLEPFARLEVSGEVARVGSRIRRSLRERGMMIGDFDILIAATALAADLPVVTDDREHFQRVDGLAVEFYRE